MRWRALMERARGEDGVAMMLAVIILFILLGLGAALMVTAAGQERAASNQQSSEHAYSLAEAALNAQVFALAQEWPTASDAPNPSSTPTLGYPTSCSAASNGTSFCPTPGDLSSAYPTSSQTCPSGTPGDTWSSSSSVTNGWTTYVRDGGPTGSSTQSLFSSSAEESMAPYDSSYSPPTTAGSVWVRAVGIVNCHMAVVVTKVSAQIESLDFPNSVLDANSFTISNNGQKDVLNTGDAAHPGVTTDFSSIDLRCTGEGGLPPDSTCAGVQNSSQIAPSASYSTSPPTSPIVSALQLAAIKSLAITNGTYFPVGDCPTSGSQLQGYVVYIDGTNSTPCNMQITANTTMNSLASPGLLVIVNGTLTLKGSSTFYGVIYAANQGNLSGTVVTLGGTTTVIGGVAVDGNGTLALSLGSSGNGQNPCTDTGSSNKCGDLEYDSAAFDAINGFAGADPTPNTFRQLPATQ
jgi:Tfp pilus assembly protein PilX